MTDRSISICPLQVPGQEERQRPQELTQPAEDLGPALLLAGDHLGQRAPHTGRHGGVELRLRHPQRQSGDHPLHPHRPHERHGHAGAQDQAGAGGPGGARYRQEQVEDHRHQELQVRGQAAAPTEARRTREAELDLQRRDGAATATQAGPEAEREAEGGGQGPRDGPLQEEGGEDSHSVPHWPGPGLRLHAREHFSQLLQLLGPALLLRAELQRVAVEEEGQQAGAESQGREGEGPAQGGGESPA